MHAYTLFDGEKLYCFTICAEHYTMLQGLFWSGVGQMTSCLSCMCLLWCMGAARPMFMLLAVVM